MLLHMADMTILGAATLIAHRVGRLVQKIRLPSLVGYMLIGVLIGPGLLKVCSNSFLEETSFITELALGLVALSIGVELKFSTLKRLGYGIVSIIFAESLMAFTIVTLAVWLFTGNLPIALIFGAVAPASAPAGTVAVIREYKAKGPLTQALYAVVGFDDGLAIVIFGLSAAVAKSLLLHEATGGTESIIMSLGTPIKEIILSILIGILAGFIFCQLIRRLTGAANMLIVVVGTVLTVVGLCQQLHLSLILTNMVVGMFFVNTRREELVKQAMSPLDTMMPFVFVLFFCLAGAHLDVTKLLALGGLGLVYALARSVGLIGGARLGASIGKVHDSIKRYVGMGILSQAGVAIGLSLIVQQELAKLSASHPEAFAKLAEVKPMYDPVVMGTTVITTITATCILFEIVGPILTRIALSRAGEIPESKAE